MRPILPLLALTLGLLAGTASAQGPAAGPYKILKTAKVGGEGGFDYVNADSASRRLYIARSGPMGRITVYDLDTLAPVGEIPGFNGHGVAIDPKSGHGFATSKPVAMFDAKTLTAMPPVTVQGNPDGILGDPAAGLVYVLSHQAPNITVIKAADGSIAGTINVDGAPEQSALDGRGHMFVTLEDKDMIAVVDTKTMTKTGAYSLEGKCGGPAGEAIDAKNHVLFVTCRNPATMTMLNADTGKIISSLPIGNGTDGATFNPATREAFTSLGEGALTIVKEVSPTNFVLEQTLPTQSNGKTLTLDEKTGHILVIAADYAPPAPDPSGAPPVPGRIRRGPMVPGSFSILMIGK
jgi:DNA-binding beta-propeller fold protein YncE